MSQEFLNTELKPYNAMTREEKHILLDAALDGNVEFTLTGESSWAEKIGDDFHPIVIYRTKPKEYKKLDLPWEYIDEYWQYAVMDGDGSVLLYATEPQWITDADIWSCDHTYHGLGALKIDTTRIVAEHSLTMRPEQHLNALKQP